MDGINGLLIIASAFSVFCQYIDNNHRAEIKEAKEKARALDLSSQVLTGLREEVDDFLAKDCLRVRSHIFALFGFLLAIIITTTYFNFHMVYSPLTAATERVVNHCITGLFGFFLAVISVTICARYIGMQAEKKTVDLDSKRYVKETTHLQYVIEYTKKTNHVVGSANANK